MARKFTKYPSNYVKATAYYVSKTQMDDWKQIARAYAKKVGAELLFVNDTSFGIEYPDGTLHHIRIEDLADLLGAGDIEASQKIKASHMWEEEDFDWEDYGDGPSYGGFASPEAFESWYQSLGPKQSGEVEGSTRIQGTDDIYTYDRYRFDTIVSKILEFWDSCGDTCTSQQIYDYLAQFGISNVSPEEFDKAWDKACDIAGASPEDDSPVVLSNGMEIPDKNKAYIWLRENVEQYGNTYFWDSSLKADLDRLIERFGSTYFWRS